MQKTAWQSTNSKKLKIQALKTPSLLPWLVPCNPTGAKQNILHLKFKFMENSDFA
ncbi:hypothetical protein [Campylobacter troglodytis]|uniref:hypothetical protein n=1 Tax=Campylobacter troglodytis TaxID=654363 RepID=UPI00163CEB1C|nr:hypothetical protein [Campylobacter troglodytis]